MGGKSSGGTTTVQKSDPWAGQQTYLTDIFSQAHDQNASGGPDYYPESTVVPFSPQTNLALQMTQNRALQGSPLNQAAQTQTLDTINGNYLNGNPYLDSIYNRGARDITNRVNAQFSDAGRT